MKQSSAASGLDLPADIDRWVADQRWFAGKGHSPVLRSIGHWVLPTDQSDVRILCHLVIDTASRFGTLYQLPLTERRTPLAAAAAGLIGQDTAADGSPRFVYDATHDPAFAAALLGFMHTGGAVTLAPVSAGEVPTGVAARGMVFQALAADGSPIAGGALTGMSVTASRVLSGEQSNTSIIIELADRSGRPARGVICKVFRVIADGHNPDVAVQSALALAGSRFVPEPIGTVSGDWTDPPAAARQSGDLVFAQEFLPGVEDAWRVALAAADAGEDFQDQARALGAATAAVHRDLASAFPTAAATADMVEQLCASMRERYRLAAREVPELAAHREAILSIFERAQAATWPRLQRIHGDYHLGQVLDVPGRGWVLIDFEGEPLRPLAERSRPDIPLRDVAGMLRSFSYAGASVMMRDPARDPELLAWTLRARVAFLEGYLGQGGTLGDQEPLLAAFELDKAIYEAVYESRNRPSWLPIPLVSVRRLANAASIEQSAPQVAPQVAPEVATGE